MKYTILLLLLLLTTAAFASTIITPDSYGGPFCLSNPFGTAACSITDQYNAGGLLLSQGIGTAVFNDPPDAWAGINALNRLDLLSPVDGAIVVPGTTTVSPTNYLAVEAGLAASGTLLLSVYDTNHSLLGTRANGLDGSGPHNRSLMILSLPGIAYFSVSPLGKDTFGVDQVQIGSAVPEPATFGLLGVAMILLGFVRRRRE